MTRGAVRRAERRVCVTSEVAGWAAALVRVTPARAGVMGASVREANEVVSRADGDVRVASAVVRVTGWAVKPAGGEGSKIDSAAHFVFRESGSSGPYLLGGRDDGARCGGGRPPWHVQQGKIIMSTNTTFNRTKNNRLVTAQKLIAGTRLHFPDVTQSITFGGTTRPVSAVVQVLQDLVDLRNAVEAAQADSKAKVALEQAGAPPLLVVSAQYIAYLRATFGQQPSVLADFGLAPTKARTPLTAEQKAAAAAKRRATRAARHTMGKNQKKAVKGAVTATVVVTPLPEPPPAPAPSPSPPPPPTSATPAGTSPSTAVTSRPSTA